MTGEFAGKHIVITGATGGLGTAVVELFLDRGAICHLPFHRAEVPDSLDWSTNERAHISRGLDLSDEATVEDYYRDRSLWASIHLVGGFAMGNIADISLADFQELFTLNAQTCFLCCREAVKAIRRGGEGGRILNVAARPALQPVPGMLAYAASKAAVAIMTRTLAAELHHDKILVNAIVPSIIDTPSNRTAMPDADFKKWPKPAEIARNIGFLTSPENDLTSGSLVPVYGQV